MGRAAQTMRRTAAACALAVLIGAIAIAEAHTPGPEAEVVSINGQHDSTATHRIVPTSRPSKVSFSYDHDHKADHSGDPAPAPAAVSNEGSITQKMVQMGTLLDGIGGGEDDSGQAVASLTSALRAKLLMDNLKPDGIGSFVAEQAAHAREQGLGEHKDDDDAQDDEDEDQEKFDKLMHAKKKNMAAITSYLMKRKAQGRPLTADEDQQLQKFYYNRASTILKKIVLLRKGETPPEFEDASETDSAASSSSVPQQQQPEDQAETADETEKLKYDATVANDNAKYDDQQARKIERQEEAEDAERMAEDKEEMDKLEFDRKIAKANEKYNDELLAQVRHEANKAKRVSMVAKRAAEALRVGLKKQDHMTKVEDELAKQKEKAQKAVARFTSEQETAESKVEAAEKAAKAAAMLAAAEKAASTGSKSKLKLPHFSTAERMHNMVEYLRTALSHHNHLSKKDLKIMQTFFLEHGGHVLSKLAQIEPDAIWNDKGVMGTEQWAMDHRRPDQLSQEWGGHRVRKETIVRDVVAHELHKRQSDRPLLRPSKQTVQGLFGASSKLRLRFAPDHSQKMDQEPELGDDDEVEELPNEYAYQSMMGIN